VARRLQSLAEGRQVLCVTHLAVIAAAASQHVRVSKSIQGARTEVALEVLRKRQREEEIARMLSGDASPQAAARHARGLLAQASEGLPAHA
jgi:DNA repair protein RecN (Recombination protein N)